MAAAAGVRPDRLARLKCLRPLERMGEEIGDGELPRIAVDEKVVCVQMHRVADRRLAQMREVELPSHVVEQRLLQNQHEMPVDVLEGLHLVMQLYQRRLRGHFPVHPVSLR